MKQKFVNISIEGQDNIGVIDLGLIDSQEGETKLCETIKSRLEPKLIEALESHFDTMVHISSINVISTLGHIEVRAKAEIGSDEQEIYTEEVVLEETWVY